VLRGPGFAATHVELAQGVINACRAAGAHHNRPRLLHMSALGADPAAPSEYLRSKGVGEQAVLAADDLAATVFRPSVIFGPEDRFLNLFAQLSAVFPVLGLAAPEARFQPVYVGDVVRAFLAALESEAHLSGTAGKSYDLCGPKEYTLRELVELACAITGRRRLVIGLPDGLSYLQAWSMEFAPVELLSRDNLDSTKVDNVMTGAVATELRVTPAAMEAVVPAYLSGKSPKERYMHLRDHARR